MLEVNISFSPRSLLALSASLFHAQMASSSFLSFGPSILHPDEQET